MNVPNLMNKSGNLSGLSKQDVFISSEVKSLSQLQLTGLPTRKGLECAVIADLDSQIICRSDGCYSTRPTNFNRPPFRR